MFKIKQQLYPKTKRLGNSKIIITEKLDGSNIGFFKIEPYLYIATRNNVYRWGDTELNSKILSYKGLWEWLEKNGEHLTEELIPGSGIFGEWLGMGHIKYPEDMIKLRFYMFAKANFKFLTFAGRTYEIIEVTNLNYNREHFIYPFVSQEIPHYIQRVPYVATAHESTIEHMDFLYDAYTRAVKRDVEGFVLNVGTDNVKKYVRMKRGFLQKHQYKK